MALIARSIEMSFSLSRPRRTLRSMSILTSHVPRLGVIKHGTRLGTVGAGPAELDLHLPWAEFGVVEFNLVTVDVQSHRGLAGHENPALHGRRPPRCSPPTLVVPASHREWRTDQPALRAAPVPGLGERPVHAGRGHLEGVRDFAHG